MKIDANELSQIANKGEFLVKNIENNWVFLIGAMFDRVISNAASSSSASRGGFR